MVISRQTSVQDLLALHEGFAEFLAWQASDALPLDPDETLGELCETWDMDWEDFEEELATWLEESEERTLPEWHEDLSGEE